RQREFDRSVRHGGVSPPFGMPCASGALETACQTPMSRWRSQGPYGVPDGPLSGSQGLRGGTEQTSFEVPLGEM
ncbi:hypothetical protein JOQ06_011605, partial [Pogonophryne albipinna]